MDWYKNNGVQFFRFSLILAAGWGFGLCEMDLRSMQGPIMIIGMKLLTVIMRRTLDDRPVGLALFLHYCLSPSSAVFGPIVPYDDFKAKVFNQKFSLPLGQLLRTIVATFLTFITANCICQSVEWVSSTEGVQPYHIVSVYPDIHDLLNKTSSCRDSSRPTNTHWSSG